MVFSPASARIRDEVLRVPGWRIGFAVGDWGEGGVGKTPEMNTPLKKGVVPHG